MIDENDPKWEKPDALWKCEGCGMVTKYGKLKITDDPHVGQITECPICESEDVFPHDPDNPQMDDIGDDRSRTFYGDDDVD